MFCTQLTKYSGYPPGYPNTGYPQQTPPGYPTQTPGYPAQIPPGYPPNSGILY